MIKILGKRLLVKPIEQEETKSGLIMVREVKDYSAKCVVIQKGTTEDEHSKHVSVGDVVHIAYPTGTKLFHDGTEYRLIDADALFAVVKEDG